MQHLIQATHKINQVNKRLGSFSLDNVITLSQIFSEKKLAT